MNVKYNDNISTEYRFSKMSDEELVRWCGHSCSDSAWEEFTRRFDRLIRHYVRRVWWQYQREGNTEFTQEVQDDLTQEVYLKLFKDGMQSLREFRGLARSSFSAFLWRICFNAVTSYYRKTVACKRRGWLVSTEELEMDEGWENGTRILVERYLSYNPEPEIIARILSCEMYKRLAELKADSRESLVLEFYLQDKRMRELSAHFGLSKGSLETLLKRARGILKARMQRLGKPSLQEDRTAA